MAAHFPEVNSGEEEKEEEGNEDEEGRGRKGVVKEGTGEEELMGMKG